MSGTLRSLCVFCGANTGADERFRAAAAETGRELARRGIRLVYGGGRTGLMGELADSALRHGGTVVGVIPRALVDREIAHTGLTDLRIVETMHERKATMSVLADAFLALPGGIGTMEEMFEVWTWSQLGIHQKMVAFLNVGGFYDSLIQFLDQLVAQQFLRAEHRGLALFAPRVAAVLDQLEGRRAPVVPKWLDLSRS